ncbi:uncharacterized protein LOC142640275 [Castanea sativa]|uniref:uncharacterized protein LOC142640275 n=1 Tax=Castanea sativa TaxID=21020 RepID=UPI003F64A333
METKSDIDWMKMVKEHCGFKDGFSYPSEGASGGLALFWDSDIQVQMMSSSVFYIDAPVEGGSKFGRWRLTTFYGNPNTSLKANSWHLLQSLSTVSDLPWVVIGDFNEIMNAKEKEGGASQPPQQMAQFNSAIDFRRLKELEFVGPLFTLIYQRGDNYQIKEQLDRALVTLDWSLLFPMARDSRCDHIVESSWIEGQRDASLFPIVSCLNLSRGKLEDWNRNVFRHVGREIARLQIQLKWLEMQPSNPGIITNIRWIRIDLNCWMEKENAMWMQRA